MLDRRTLELRKEMRQEDFDIFAKLSGDDNPIHVDAGFAATTRFEKTVAHGMFLFSIITELQRKLIGDSTSVRETALMFPAPSRAGEVIVFQAEVTREDGQQEVKVIAQRESDGETVCRYSAIAGADDAS